MEVALSILRLGGLMIAAKIRGGDHIHQRLSMTN